LGTTDRSLPDMAQSTFNTTERRLQQHDNIGQFWPNRIIVSSFIFLKYNLALIKKYNLAVVYLLKACLALEWIRMNILLIFHPNNMD